jgi:hypothetical protein
MFTCSLASCVVMYLARSTSELTHCHDKLTKLMISWWPLLICVCPLLACRCQIVCAAAANYYHASTYAATGAYCQGWATATPTTVTIKGALAEPQAVWHNWERFCWCIKLRQGNCNCQRHSCGCHNGTAEINYTKWWHAAKAQCSAKNTSRHGTQRRLL